MTGQAPRGWGIVVSPDGVGSEGLSFGMQDVDVGSAIPYHVHDKEEEILFFWRGQGKCVVNTGDEPLRLTWCFSPPGYEKEFRRMSETGEDHEAPPPEKAV